ncbi:hypothetical protein ElyMa_006497400 [Elysia marginata]|uniref:Uncharacterized protein n=1 Tax=Elysia marginata TaxID=1093978 RepID=A0AAV4I281_9GAST|nr:hypothetical protein ElyMa_006497400 [Elysia marginata]
MIATIRCIHVLIDTGVGFSVQSKSKREKKTYTENCDPGRPSEHEGHTCIHRRLEEYQRKKVISRISGACHVTHSAGVVEVRLNRSCWEKAVRLRVSRTEEKSAILTIKDKTNG